MDHASCDYEQLQKQLGHFPEKETLPIQIDQSFGPWLFYLVDEETQDNDNVATHVFGTQLYK